jgi:hypothetical protein
MAGRRGRFSAREKAVLVAVPLLLLLAVFRGVLGGGQTLLPHAPGVFYDGPAGYRMEPDPCVMDPWGMMWEEVPLARVVHGQVVRGIPPLWNPWSACGMPLSASLCAEAFSPVRWPLLAHPTPRAWDFFLLARLFITGVLAAALALELGTGLAGALVAGISWMLGGYLVFYLNLFHLDVDAFLPGLLLCLIRVLRGGGTGWRLGLAGTVAQTLLGGNPEAALLASVLALAWLAEYCRDDRRARSRLPAVALCVLAGAALALPLYLPFAEFFFNAFHIHGKGSGVWWGGASLPPAGWPAFLVPLSYGPVFRPVNFAMPAMVPYAGVGVVLLAFQGVGWGAGAARRLGYLSAVVAVLELAKIFGVPPVSWLGTLPGFGLIVWIKYQAPLALSAALLAGLGTARIVAGKASRRTFYWSLGLLAAGAGWSGWVTGDRLSWAVGWGFAAMLVAGWVLLVFASRRPRLGAWAGWMAVALVGAELAGWVPVNRARAHDPFTPAPYIEYLRARLPGPEAGRVFGLGFSLAPQVNAGLGLAVPGALVAPLVFRPFWEYMDANVAEPRRPAFMAFLKADVLDSRALEALSFMGVRYIVTTRGPDRVLAPGTAWPLKRVLAGEMNVYENPRARPRAFVLETGGGVPVPARITRYEPMRVEIVPPASGGRLVLTDTAYPGWRAFIGGERVKIAAQAGVFRSVEVRGGAPVRFCYAPLPFALGLWLAGVLGLAGLLLLPVLRR